MAINASKIQARLSDRRLFFWAAIGFPLLVLLGYFKTYYFSHFFDVKPLANSLVHLHGVTMSLWVVYFTAQILLVRSKNVKLHMTLGMAGIALAVIVVIVGMATAYDSQLVRKTAPPGMDPHSFFIIPVGDMALFLLYFAGAIYYRKRAAEHKALMLMTAINFLPAAFARMPLYPPEYAVAIGGAASTLLAVGCLVWHSVKHRKLNRVFLAAVVIFIASAPARIAFSQTEIWLGFTRWLAGG